LTIGLTVVVLGGSWYVWRVKEREISKDTDNKGEDKVKDA
jgi:hypothetical protein